MQSLIFILLGLAVISISACSNTASKGYGGFAEHDLANVPDHVQGLENALYFEQQISRLHLDDLILAGAKVCFPASVKTAQIRQNRIARELQGGLEADAANDLIIQRDQLARLERRLNYVQFQGSCINTPAQKEISGSELSAEKLEIIRNLLNNNNQFVFASSELNPRYIGHLAEAATMLRDHPSYQLKITGHADAKGSDKANLELSLQRARQVERYLQIFGVNPNSIDVQGQGAKVPLFQGDDAPTRLINRRVSIEVINSN